MEQSSERRDIILIGGSMGALDGLKKIVARLPADLPASLFVTLHIARESPGILAEILNRCGPLPARLAAHGERIERGIIYVAPPDFHLLVHPGHTHVSRGPRENRHRPAIDPMFRTAAKAYRNRVAAVILSGLLDDGAAGLMAVRAAGGLAIVQDPAEESWGDMARAAIDYAGADYILPLEEIGSFIEGLAGGNLPIRSAAGEAAMPEGKAKQKDEAELKTGANQEHEGEPSPFACPECHGVLWEVEDGQLLRFRCRVGHAYTASALNEGLSEGVEDALWVALRTLEEKAQLLRRMAKRSTRQIAASYSEQAQGYDTHAGMVRRLLIQMQHAEERVETREEVQQ